MSRGGPQASRARVRVLKPHERSFGTRPLSNIHAPRSVEPLEPSARSVQISVYARMSELLLVHKLGTGSPSASGLTSSSPLHANTLSIARAQLAKFAAVCAVQKSSAIDSVSASARFHFMSN